jgi:hypothetical protein
MSTGVVGKKRVIFEVCSETKILIVVIELSTPVGHVQSLNVYNEVIRIFLFS